MENLTRIKNNTDLNKRNIKKCCQQAVKGFFRWQGGREITLETEKEYRQILIDSNSLASKINTFLFGIQCRRPRPSPRTRKGNYYFTGNR